MTSFLETIGSDEEVQNYIQARLPTLPDTTVRRLAGSLWQRDMQLDHCLLAAAALFRTPDKSEKNQYQKNMATLRSISRRQAFRAMMLLPLPIVGPEAIPKSHTLENLDPFYVGVALWLLDEDLHLGISGELTSSMYGVFYKYFQLSFARYNLISPYLKHTGSTLSAPYVWFVSECASCWNRFNQTAENLPQTKGKAFTRRKQYLDAVLDCTLEIQKADSTVSAARDIEYVVDVACAQLAEKDNSFNRLYFKPYMFAQRQWNEIARRSKILLGPQQRPGRKIGQKRKCKVL